MRHEHLVSRLRWLMLLLFSGFSAMGQHAAQFTIHDELYITLGGEKQYVEIMGSSPGNPVLLFLHGGPGWPQTPQLRYFNSELAKYVTLVSWDQRGCGKSYMIDPDPKNLTLDQLILDGHELTRWLQKRFKTQKIYLAGFSWGSVIGINLAARYPADYAAYFGISQVVNLRKSIRLSGDWIKREAQRRKDTVMLRNVERLQRHDTSFCSGDLDCFLKKYEMLTAYHGAIYHPGIEKAVDASQVYYPDYKKYDWMKGFNYSAGRLGAALFTTDITGIRELRVPVYFFVGRHDWNLPTSVTVDYFNELQAPEKEMVWFGNSAHEPLEEEAHLFDEALIKRIRHL